MQSNQPNPLANKVWVTHKSRIAAEKRINRYDFYSQFVLVWYSALLLLGSIYTLKEPSEFGSMCLVMFSALVLVASVFISGRGYCRRGLLLRHCYEDLGRLYGDIITADDGALSKENWDSYYRILGISENHSEVDYFVAMVSEKFKGGKLESDVTGWMIARTLFSFAFSLVLFLIVIFFPFLAVFYFYGHFL